MNKTCVNCGAQIPEDRKFCTECGAAMDGATVTKEAPKAPPPQPAYVQPAYSGEYIPPAGSKYEPITTKGFIGIMLLMCIPIVGQVLMIIWALGGCKKINKRNLARAALIMMIIGLVIGFIFSFLAKKAIEGVMAEVEKETGISFAEQAENGEEESGGIWGSLGSLAGLLGDGDIEYDGNNKDIEALEELEGLLGAITGGEGSGLEDFINEAQDINAEAEKANDGWPKSLREYPGGKATAIASYRTEISDTSLEEMLAWIEDLKKDGFEYKDFYDFGMTEEDMLSVNGWWATDGEIYLSLSYSDGKVTIDHTKELPDLSGLFG